MKLERSIADVIGAYTGQLAIQSFDSLSVFNLRRMMRDRPVGQIPGSLRSAGCIADAVVRSVIINFATTTDYVSYELGSLPSKYVDYWSGKRGLINIVTNDRSGELHATSTLGNVRLGRGRWQEAIGYYEQALTIAREVGNEPGERCISGNLDDACRAPRQSD